jgi:hypothetical protein
MSNPSRSVGTTFFHMDPSPRTQSGDPRLTASEREFWRPTFIDNTPRTPENIFADTVPEGARWNGFRLHWVKIIGRGGLGLATLWEAEFEDGHRQLVVIKMDMSKNKAKMSLEASWNERYRGASHIMQAVDLNKLAEQHRHENRFRGGYDFDPNKFNVLVLEYAQYGSLLDLLIKASYYNIHFSNKVLWQIWGCCKYLKSQHVYFFNLFLSPYPFFFFFFFLLGRCSES